LQVIIKQGRSKSNYYKIPSNAKESRKQGKKLQRGQTEKERS
jgi:hypothetical protein